MRELAAVERRVHAAVCQQRIVGAAFGAVDLAVTVGYLGGNLQAASCTYVAQASTWSRHGLEITTQAARFRRRRDSYGVFVGPGPGQRRRPPARRDLVIDRARHQQPHAEHGAAGVRPESGEILMPPAPSAGMLAEVRPLQRDEQMG
jgi:hypothetical protein